MGWTIALVGYLIVFAALILLSVIFTNIPKLMRKFRKRKNKKADSAEDLEEISADVNAAIAMALYLHFDEMHDEESNVITIKRVEKPYSPWSSKIYGVRNRPVR